MLNKLVLSLLENEKYLKYALAAVIVMLGLLCYANGFNNEFTWDGRQYIMANTYISPLNWKNLSYIFSSFELGNYHPLTMLSYAIEAFFFGQKNAFWYHVDQLLLHSINSYLIFEIFRKIGLNRSISALSAILFLVHPLHVETVIWEAQRKDTLYCLFFLLGFNSYIAFIQKNDSKYLWWCLGWFVCSCLSKAMAVVLPAVLVASDVLLFNRKISLKLFTEKALFWIIALFFGWLATKAQKDIGADGSEIFARLYTWGDRLLMASYSFCFYWIKLIWPAKLSAFYPFPAKPFSGFITFAPFVLAAFIAIFFIFYTKNKLYAWCIVFFAICIFPVLQLLPIGSAIVAERYFYVSSIGPILLLSLGMNKIPRNLKFGLNLQLLVWFIIVNLFIYKTIDRVKIWQSDYTLFKNVLTQFPENGFINGNVGWYFESQKKDMDSALVYFEKANTLGWNTADIAARKGTILFNKKKYDLSINEFKNAINLNPKYQNIYWMLATSYFYLDSLNQAKKYIAISEKSDSSAFYAYNLKGLMAEKNGGFLDAEKAYKKSMAIFAGNEEPYLNLAHLYHQNNKFAEEITTLEKLIEILPIHPEMMGYKNLGAAYVSQNEVDKAISLWKKALERNPKADAEFPFNIGLQYGLKDDADNAILWLRKAAKLNHQEAQNILKNKNINW